MTTIITVDLDISLDEHARKELVHLLPDLVESVLVLREAGYEHIDKELLSLLVGGPRLTAADVRRALADAEAIRAVYRGTQWLTAKELAEFASPTGSIAQVRRWQRRRQIFAIRHQGADYFPRYALGGDFHPLRAVGRVMKVLREYSADRLALWFESPSEALEGRRPREVIARAPKRVVAVAELAAAADRATRQSPA
jgi:hypothetical protein